MKCPSCGGPVERALGFHRCLRCGEIPRCSCGCMDPGPSPHAAGEITVQARAECGRCRRAEEYAVHPGDRPLFPSGRRGEMSPALRGGHAPPDGWVWWWGGEFLLCRECNQEAERLAAEHRLFDEFFHKE